MLLYLVTFNKSKSIVAPLFQLIMCCLLFFIVKRRKSRKHLGNQYCKRDYFAHR